VKELSNEGMSQREIDEVLGVGLGTVNRDLDDVPNGTSDVNDPEEKKVQGVSNGTTQTKTKPSTSKPARPVTEEEIKAA
jgi:hypothetical protein